MRNLLPEPIYSLAELVLPPRNLYEPLFIANVDLNREDGETTATFEHRYKGPHSLGIRVEFKIPNSAKTYDWGGRFEAMLEESGKTILRRATGESPSPWWTRSENGFDFFHYIVPAEATLGRPIRLRFRVVKKGSGYPPDYGSASLYVSRISSK